MNSTSGGSVNWNNAYAIASGFTAPYSGFVILNSHFNDCIITATITTTSGSAIEVGHFGHGDHAFRAENVTWTLPIQKGCTITFSGGNYSSYFVPLA